MNRNQSIPLRIAIVVNSFPVLSETFIFNKVMGLLESGLHVDVFVQQEKNDIYMFSERIGARSLPPIRKALTAGGLVKFPFHLVSSLMCHPYQSLKLWRQAISLYGLKKKAFVAWLKALPLVLGRYEIVHFEYSGIAVSFMDSIPLLRPMRVLTSCRGAAEQIVPHVNVTRAEQLRHLLPLLDKVHCVSLDMQHTVERYGLFSGQAIINYPSIDIEQFLRSQPYPIRDKGPYYLITVGRLHWKKGLEYGMLALQQLIEQGFEVVYQIIGRGDEEERLRFAIHDLGLEDHVELLGQQSAEAIREALENADIFVLPSLSEGISNAALEAMAMELPIVSTSAGGMPEAITHGVEGFLVESRNPEQLASQIAILLKNSELRFQMGRLGRQRIERDFSLNRQIRVFMETYRELCPLPVQ